MKPILTSKLHVLLFLFLVNSAVKGEEICERCIEPDISDESEFIFNGILYTSGGLFTFYEQENSSGALAQKRTLLSDRMLSAGIYFTSEKIKNASGFHMDMAVNGDAGNSRQIAKHALTPAKRMKDSEDAAYFIPGNRMIIQKSFRNTAFFAGRTDFTADQNKRAFIPDQETEFYTIHGITTGAGLLYKNKDVGELYLFPYFEPQLSGSYLRKNIFNDIQPDSFFYGSRKFNEDAKKLKSSPNRYAYQFLYSNEIKNIYFSAGYGTSEYITGSPVNQDERKLNHLEFISFAIGYGRMLHETSFFLFLQTEHSGGYFKKPFNYEEKTDSETISGNALLAAAGLKTKHFSGKIRYFLPEPRTELEENGMVKKKSGYTGFGNTYIYTPVLRQSLVMNPHPSPCIFTEQCQGILKSSEETFYNNHASALNLSLGWESEFFRTELSLQGVFPLAERTENGKNPFQKLKRRQDTEWMEGELSAVFTGDSVNIQISYSRLYRRIKKRNDYAGQSFTASITCGFFS